ncbi:hypothetical protein WJX84_006989 [Apatococcus fuscideae]|uniref:MBD domain-containing protein n=1 Tax=Apatococcus fuscideae TaxID=2026836 RepID=A0AAW1T505_9CHLO
MEAVCETKQSYEVELDKCIDKQQPAPPGSQEARPDMSVSDPVTALRQLREEVHAAGGSLVDGWTAIKVLRKDGKGNAGDTQIYYLTPAGKKLRSKHQVFDFLKIPRPAQLSSDIPAASHSSHRGAAASEGTSHPAESSRERSRIHQALEGVASEAAAGSAGCATEGAGAATYESGGMAAGAAHPPGAGLGAKRLATAGSAAARPDKKHRSIPSSSLHSPARVRCGPRTGLLDFRTWRITCECADCMALSATQRVFSGPQYEVHGGKGNFRKWRSQSVRVIDGMAAGTEHPLAGISVNTYCMHNNIRLPEPHSSSPAPAVSNRGGGPQPHSLPATTQQPPHQMPNGLAGHLMPVPNGMPNGVRSGGPPRQVKPAELAHHQQLAPGQPAAGQWMGAQSQPIPMQNGLSMAGGGQQNAPRPLSNQVFHPGPMHLSSAAAAGTPDLGQRVQHLEAELMATQSQVRMLLDGMATLRAIFRAAGSTFEELMPSIPQ